MLELMGLRRIEDNVGVVYLVTWENVENNECDNKIKKNGVFEGQNNRFCFKCI